MTLLIWVHDGSSQAVVDRLAEILPERFKPVSPAAVEMHATMDLLNDNLVRLDLTEDTYSEWACSPALPHDLSDPLMLKDAGYFEQVEKTFISTRYRILLIDY